MKKYKPEIHNRKSTRLKGYDYSKPGRYFITMCCQNRICRFGHIVGAGLVPNGTIAAPAQMILNEYGEIAHHEWIKLSDRFSNFESDTFQIMPNHIHAIMILTEPVGAGLAPALDPNNAGLTPALVPNDTDTENDTDKKAGASPAPAKTVGNIIVAYKSLVANGCLDIYKTKNEIMGKLWQRNFHDHILRTETDAELNRIRNYIRNNPKNWKENEFYSAGFRGGDWNNNATNMQVSDRNNGANTNDNRNNNYGSRGVRSVP